MKIHDILASVELRPYINRYWLWEKECELPAMLPGTGAELFFQYGGSPMAIEHSITHMTYLSYSALLQPRHQKIQFKVVNPVDFISVRFTHGSLRHFCPMPTIELNDYPLTARDIWGIAGYDLEMWVIEAKSLAERIKLLNIFLYTQLLNNYKNQHPWFKQAIADLYYSKQSIQHVVETTGISARYFQKTFKENSGVSPKYFQSIARFEQTIKHLLLAKNNYYLEYVLEQGYYDQSHFIKVCKQFSQMTPLEYLQEKNFKTHFYNRSLFI